MCVCVSVEGEDEGSDWPRLCDVVFFIISSFSIMSLWKREREREREPQLLFLNCIISCL